MYLWVETTHCELLRQVVMFSLICWSKKKMPNNVVPLLHHCVCAARSQEYSNRLFAAKTFIVEAAPEAAVCLPPCDVRAASPQCLC